MTDMKAFLQSHSRSPFLKWDYCTYQRLTKNSSLDHIKLEA